MARARSQAAREIRAHYHPNAPTRHLQEDRTQAIRTWNIEMRESFVRVGLSRHRANSDEVGGPRNGRSRLLEMAFPRPSVSRLPPLMAFNSFSSLCRPLPVSYVQLNSFRPPLASSSLFPACHPCPKSLPMTFTRASDLLQFSESGEDH